MYVLEYVFFVDCLCIISGGSGFSDGAFPMFPTEEFCVVLWLVSMLSPPANHDVSSPLLAIGNYFVFGPRDWAIFTISSWTRDVLTYILFSSLVCVLV